MEVCAFGDQDLPDDENCAEQLQSRLAAYATNSVGLKHWLHRFELLVHTVDSSQSPEDVYNEVKKLVEGILEAKDTADSIAQQADMALKAAKVCTLNIQSCATHFVDHRHCCKSGNT